MPTRHQTVKLVEGSRNQAYSVLRSIQVETLEFNVKLIKMEEFKAPDSETIDKLLQYLTSIYQKKKVRTYRNRDIQLLLDLKFFNTEMNSLQPLLVTCSDGRSGVVMALYFMAFYDFSSSEAIEKVREKGQFKNFSSILKTFSEETTCS